MQHNHRRLWPALLATLLAGAVLGMAGPALVQDTPPPSDAELIAAADAVAQAQREVGDIGRTIDRRTAERDAVEVPAVGCEGDRDQLREDDQAAWRACRQLDWYADVLRTLEDRQAAAAGRLAAAEAALSALGGKTLAQRVAALEATTDELSARLTAVNAKVDALMPPSCPDDPEACTETDVQRAGEVVRATTYQPADFSERRSCSGASAPSNGIRPPQSEWPAECAHVIARYRLILIAVRGVAWPL